MEEVPLSRAYLESLTTGDLLGIADSLGVDISNNPDRVLVIEELLEASSPGGGRASVSKEPEMTDSVLVESVPLPKQYNITFIEVMIRDPLWAFVFWEIKASDKEQFEKADNFDGYYLKVSHLEDSGNEELFKVPVKPDDTAWYLSLSPALESEVSRPDQGQFKVEFCATLGGIETALAVSSPVRLPGLPSACGTGRFANGYHGSAEVWENQLVRLSGYENFHVLRKNERQLRVKKGEGEDTNG